MNINHPFDQECTRCIFNFCLNLGKIVYRNHFFYFFFFKVFKYNLREFRQILRVLEFFLIIFAQIFHCSIFVILHSLSKDFRDLFLIEVWLATSRSWFIQCIVLLFVGSVNQLKIRKTVLFISRLFLIYLDLDFIFLWSNCTINTNRFVLVGAINHYRLMMLIWKFIIEIVFETFQIKRNWFHVKLLKLFFLVSKISLSIIA